MTVYEMDKNEYKNDENEYKMDENGRGVCVKCINGLRWTWKKSK